MNPAYYIKCEKSNSRVDYKDVACLFASEVFPSVWVAKVDVKLKALVDSRMYCLLVEPLSSSKILD